MSEMIREYGKTVAAILVAMLVLLLLFGQLGFWKILEDGAYIMPLEYDEYEDREVLTKIMEGAFPRIEYRYPHIGKGEHLSMEELFFGLDGDGNFLEVKLLSAFSPQGEEIAVVDGVISFEKMGIYQCQVYATDAQGRRTEKYFKIPVLRE